MLEHGQEALARETCSRRVSQRFRKVRLWTNFPSSRRNAAEGNEMGRLKLNQTLWKKGKRPPKSSNTSRRVKIEPEREHVPGAIQLKKKEEVFEGGEKELNLGRGSL